MSINNQYYTVADYIFDPLGVIRQVEGQEKFKLGMKNHQIEKIFQIVMKVFAVIGSALLNIATLFIPFTVYCYNVRKENQENNKNLSEAGLIASNESNNSSEIGGERIRELTSQEFTTLLNDAFYELNNSSEIGGEEIGGEEIGGERIKELTSEEFRTLLNDANYLFPDDKIIHVTGDLNFRDGVGLNKLPKNLSVNGNVTFSKYQNEISIPNNFSINGDLFVEKCKNLKLLSDNLTVRGRVIFRECQGEISLPDKFSLQMRQYSSRDGLPSDWPVSFYTGGNLIVEKCKNLKLLSDNLSISESASFYECQGEISLSKNISFESDVYISQCKDLKFQFDQIVFGKSLKIKECNALALSGDFSIKLGLSFDKCSGKISLPDSFCIGTCLSFSECANLNLNSNELTVNMNLNFWECQGVISLPEKVIVQGDLSLMCSEDLEIKCANLAVEGKQEQWS